METDGHPAAVADESERMAAIARAARRPRGAGRARRGGRRWRWPPRDGMRSPRWRVAGRPRSSRTSPCRGASWRRWWRSSPRRRASTGSRSARSATWATATCTRRSSPTSANADEMQRVHHALDAIVTKTLALGGTITGEHGVGLAKKAWLRQQMGDEQLRADEADQARPRSGRAAESREDLRLIDVGARSAPSTTRCCSSACTAACACRRARPTTRRSASATARAAASR